MILYDIFLSYRREDGEEIAKAVYDYLTAKGLRVFFDQEKMVDGHYFDTQIRTVLEQAPNYVLLATPKVFPFRKGEDWVREEITRALDLYDHNQEDRSFTVLALPETVFPKVFDERIEKLKYPNRILLPNDILGEEEKRRLLRAVTHVNRQNLWHAAHNWWEESRATGHRFAGLSIDQTIMPQARPKERLESRFPIDVYQKEQESTTTPVPLLEALKETKGHLYLIGQGGIGKTTALMRIMEMAYQNQAYSETAQIPIFVELSRAPDTDGKLYDRTGSSFIRRAVYQLVRRDRKVKQVTERAVEEVEDVFSIDPETAVEPVNDLFTKKTPAPEYLLLLDGLNEVSRTEVNVHYPVVTLIIQEIQWLMTNCHNVRVILTSRTDEEAVFHEGVTRLYLSEIKQETIADYFTRYGRTPEETAALLEDEKLAETLGVPLFLTLYAALKDTRDVTSRGEIFRTFFHEREEGLGTYTVQSRAARVEQDVAESASLQSSLRVTAKMQSFMLDFLLPEIAWEMERREVFYLDEFEIEKIITPVLTGTEDTDICGKYGRTLFEKYREGVSTRAHTKKTAKQLMTLGNEDPEEVAELVLDTCLLSLGILQANHGKYGFMHHHIRDYFAAAKNVNSLEMAVYLGEDDGPALDCLKDWRDRPVFPEVRRFVGEMLGEHHNSPVCSNGVWRYNVPEEPCDRNLIERALDLYRGRFSGDDGYALYSLTSILKDVRGDLSGMDLSRLDLSYCSFNGIPLGKISLASKLQGASLNPVNIFPMGHNSAVVSATLSPDGSRLLTASTDATAKIWDEKTGICIVTLRGHNDGLTYACFNNDGGLVLTVSKDMTVKLWDASKGKCLLTLVGHNDIINSAAFSPKGDTIVTASEDGTAKIWDARNGKCILTLEGRVKAVKYATYNTDGSMVVTVSTSKKVRIWDVSSGNCIHSIETRQLRGSVKELWYACFIPDGSNKILIGCYVAFSDAFIIWDPSSGNIENSRICTHYHPYNPNPTVCFSPDGRKLLTISTMVKIRNSNTGKNDYVFVETVKIRNSNTGKIVQQLEGHTDDIVSLNFSPDGSKVVTVSKDETIKIWSADTGQCQKTLLLINSKTVNSASYNPVGNRIVTASKDRTAKIWDVVSRKCILTLHGHIRGVKSASYSPDGGQIVTAGSNDCTAKIWDSTTGQCIHTLLGHEKSVVSASFNPDGSEIVTASLDTTARIWDAKTAKQIRTISDQSSSLLYASHSPNGRIIATVVGYSDIWFWDVGSGRWRDSLGRFHGHWERVSEVNYSPDGSRIVTASYDKTAKIWNAITGQNLNTLKEHNEAIISARYSPDGERITTASYDKTAKIWDARTGVCLLTLKGHTGALESASYSPDGLRIITASHDGTVKIWDSETGKYMDTLPNIPGLIVHGVDFRNLHPNSRFTEEEKELLRRYGAIVDDTDT